VEVAKALGGSFKSVTLAPKTVREMTQLLGKQNGQQFHYISTRTISAKFKHAELTGQRTAAAASSRQASLS